MKYTLVIVFLTLVLNSTSQSVLQFDNDIKLQITITEFQLENHRVDTCFFKNKPYLCKIDGNDWFGMDMGLELPKYELKEIVVFDNGEKIYLDVTQMFNPVFGTTRSKRQFDVNLVNNQIEVDAWFSDGAGTYCAKWIVSNGSSKRTLLSESESDCFE